MITTSTSGVWELNEVYSKRNAERWRPDGVGLFVWAKLPAGILSEEFIDKVLIEKHIFITPGTIFGNNGEGYIRFSLCVTEEKIQQAIDRF